MQTVQLFQMGSSHTTLKPPLSTKPVKRRCSHSDVNLKHSLWYSSSRLLLPGPSVWFVLSHNLVPKPSDVSQ